MEEEEYNEGLKEGNSFLRLSSLLFLFHNSQSKHRDYGGEEEGE